ncbi:MAG: GWxTD domain-containing protein [Acidobacteriota bacterium]
MKRLAPLIVPLLWASGLLFSDEKLLPKHQEWIEDVSPIITKTERDVFAALRTSAERDKFILLFWRARDPLPDTSQNEFEKEYRERLWFADQTFGHDSPKRGSRTDRGFYYLLLGPPIERRLFTTQSDMWPLELWFYKGPGQYGLPPFFYLVFYQPQGIGDYRLYYPGIDGPEKLVSSRMSVNPGQRGVALQILKRTSSELAGASLSYIPGEQPGGLGSPSSASLLASIKQLPEKQYSAGYARSYLSLKDHVEADYLTNYLNSSFQVKIFRQGGQPFIHWTIEPEKMNFGTRGDDIYASFELVIRLEDAQGSPILEKSEEIPLHLTAEQFKSHERQRFAFQDVLAVIPGEHRAVLLLKNKTARDFSSFETGLSVPGGGEARLSAPLLFHGRDAVPESQKSKPKAFVVDGVSYFVDARNEFMPAETIGVLVQAWNFERLGLSASPSAVLEIVSLDDGKTLATLPLSSTSSTDDTRANGLTLVATYSLADVKPGYYRVEVSAVGPDGKRLLTEKESFTVLARQHPTVPWVYARLHEPFPGPEHLMMLGAEYFAARDYGSARDALSKALQAQDDPAARLLLAKSLYGQGSYRESLDQAIPLYQRKPEPETAKLIALDFAALHDWASSVEYLEKLMGETTEIGVLNLAAECYLNLGYPEKALPLVQKSLALLPNQPSMKEIEAQARKRLGRE